MKCAFCEGNDKNERIIFSNELAEVFPSNQPIVVGHTLIIPKRCVATFAQLNSEEQKAIFDLMEQTKSALKQTFGCEGFNFAWNEGELAGQSVSHFHLHVLPRREGDRGVYKYSPREFLYRPGVRGVSPQEELIEVADLIRKNYK